MTAAWTAPAAPAKPVAEAARLLHCSISCNLGREMFLQVIGRELPQVREVIASLDLGDAVSVGRPFLGRALLRLPNEDAATSLRDLLQARDLLA